MARKRRKSPTRGRKKKPKALRKKKSRPTQRKRKLRRRRTLSRKVASAYHTVVDTIKGADELRNKMEPPATSETE